MREGIFQGERKMNRILKMISVLLVISLMINIAQPEIIAESIADSGTSGENGTSQSLRNAPTEEELEATLQEYLSADDEEKEAVIVEEIEEKRDRYTKYFMRDDMSYTAAEYGVPVHFENEDGSWEEIDNTLQQTQNEEGRIIYENKNSALKVRFDADSMAEKLVTISKDSKEISWKIEGAAAGSTSVMSRSALSKSSFSIHSVSPSALTAEMELSEARTFREASANEEIEEYNLDRMTVQNAVSAGQYENVLPNIDLEYEIKGETVKENIILKSAQAANTDISFRINHEGMDIERSEDGSLLVVDREGEKEAIYRFDAPYMYDAAGEMSDSVELILASISQDESILTVVADKQWLSDSAREYPVVIDPITQTAQNVKEIWDINVRENQTEPYLNTSDNFWVGRNSSGEEFRSFVRFIDLPTLEPGAQVIYARFVIYSYGSSYETADGKVFSVHKVTQDWAQTGMMWSAQPSFESNALDFAVYEKQAQNMAYPYELDVTEAVQSWYRGESSNYGLALKGYNPQNNEIMVFASSDAAAVNSAVRPQLHVSYRHHGGLEDYWTYHSHSAGESGTGYVNDFTGNLVFQTAGIDIGDAVNPFSLYLTYNSIDANTNATTHPTQRNRFGKGFRLNVVQRVDATGLEDHPYSFTDGDGTKHYFKAEDMKDEDGLGLTLSIETVDYSYKIVNKEETSTMYFDSQGYLRKIVDTNGNWISFNYAPENGDHILRNITTNTGALVTLAYYGDNNEKLKTIRDAVGRVTTFRYEQENYLTNIDHPDGTTTRIDYDGYGMVKTVRNSDGSGIQYVMSTDRKVKEVYERSTGWSNYRLLYSIDYKLNETEFTDQLGRDTFYEFNSLGLTKAVYDNKKNVSTADYSSSRNSMNKLTGTAGSYGLAVSLVKNGDFSRSKDGWINYGSSEIAAGGFISGNVAKFTGATVNDTNELWQIPTGPYEGTYTLSAYVKTTDVQGTGARLHAVVRDNETDEPRVIYSEPITGTTNRNIDGGFQRISLTFEVLSTEYMDRVGIGLSEASGTAEICNVQFEKSDAANQYNIIQNGGFDLYGGTGQIPYAWNDPGSGYGILELAQPIDGRDVGVVFNGAPTELKKIMCGVPVSGGEGDIYHLGGWINCSGVTGNNRDIRIAAAIIYSDGTARWVRANANPYIEGWQYVSAIVNTDDGNPMTDLSYTSIHLYLMADKQINRSIFNNIQLVRDFGGSYTYDDDGNQVSVIDKAEQENSFTYDDNNTISKILNPDNSSYEYAKDGNKNIINAFSSDGIAVDLKYDGFGNATSSKTQSISYIGAVIPGEQYYIRNQYSGKCLDLNLDSLVQNEKDTASGTQKWEVLDAGSGYYSFKNLSTGKVIGVPDGTAQDTVIGVYDRDNSSAQRFRLEADRYGWYRISPQCAPNNAVTNYGTSAQNSNRIWTVAYAGGQSQGWCFEPVANNSAASPQDGGVYLIRSAASNKIFDVNNASASDGSQIIQQFHSTGKNQQFMLKDAGDGYYKIVPMHAPSKVLEFSGTNSYESKYRGLVINTDTGADSQKWSFESVGSGLYKIVNKAYGTCIDLPKGYCDTGITLIEFPYSQSVNQHWRLETVSEEISGSAVYDSTTGVLKSTTDTRGNTTQYDYQAYRGTLNSTTDPNGTVTSYTYDANTDAIKSVSSAGTTVSYDYDSSKRLSSITHNGFSYGFEYDSWGNVIKTTAAGNTLAANTYDTNRNLLTGVTYGNGHTVGYVYDRYYDRVTEKQLGGVTKFKYYYDNMGNLARTTDLQNNLTKYFSYDLIGRAASMNTSDGLRLSLKYDASNRVSRYVWDIENTSYISNFYYDDNYYGLDGKPGRMMGFSTNNGYNMIYSYDRLGRRTTNRLETAARPYIQSFTYLDGAGENGATTLISHINSNGLGCNYDYTYDKLGNIMSISEDGVLVATYVYDSLNRLRREDDYLRHRSYTYTYDAGGNITSKKESVFQNGEIITDLATTTYSYDSAWKDKLVNYAGESITYDEIGNPLQYRGGLSFTWQNGRQLAAVSKSGLALAQYSYNDEGIRVSKTVNGVTTKYYLDNGSAILRQEDGTNVIDFMYDENGSAVGFVHNGNKYIYTKNVQGDVTGIIDYLSMEVIANYRYDAWGKLISVTDVTGTDVSGNANHIANVNPIRYRGYYYDTETGLYYLNSRYYDPEIGRFVNADGLVDNRGVTFQNLFSYCVGNPIMYIDSAGTCVTAWEKGYRGSCPGINSPDCYDNYDRSLIKKAPLSSVGAAQPYINMPGSSDENSPNCYAYAIGSPVNEQPGAASGRTPTKWNDVNDVGKSVEADLKAKGYTVRVISGPDTKVYNNEYKIALRVGTKPYAYDIYTGQLYYDYHFMRQTNTGQWAEKHGIGGASVLWDPGMTPDTIPWTLSGAPYYDSAIIYYAVGN